MFEGMHRNSAAVLDYRSISLETDRFPLRLSADQLPLLVTGISGVAGLNIFAFLRKRYGDLVLGQRPVNTRRLSGPGVNGIDLEDTQGIARLLTEQGIRSVLSTGGSCALKGCELDVQMAQRVNVGTVASLLDAISSLPKGGKSIRLMHLSIDLVYGGARGGWHRESDPADPVTIYGRTMLEAEQLVQSRRPDAAIGRISLPMGISFNSHAGAIDWIQSRFAKGRPATLYFDEVRTPTYVECLAEVCEELLAGEFRGLWHLGGPRPLSLNEIAQIVNRVGGYDPELLKGCYRMQAGPIPPRAGNVTMDSRRLADALGREPFQAWPNHPGLVPDARDWHYDRSGFRGSAELIRDLLYCRQGQLP